MQLFRFATLNLWRALQAYAYDCIYNSQFILSNELLKSQTYKKFYWAWSQLPLVNFNNTGDSQATVTLFSSSMIWAARLQQCSQNYLCLLLTFSKASYSVNLWNYTISFHKNQANLPTRSVRFDVFEKEGYLVWQFASSTAQLKTSTKDVIRRFFMKPKSRELCVLYKNIQYFTIQWNLTV